tara:strand:- start:457 stop:762 length:306 start_codon:yes stop_codon:yes gene_type:complete
MIHFIRDKDNNTIVDCEAMKDDMSCQVNIYNFYLFLMDYSTNHYPVWPIDRLDEAARDFDNVQEIRGLYWERNELNETPDEMAARVLKELAEKYDLYYVTD